MIESLKTNTKIKGLPKYVGEHVLPVLETKVDQTLKKVLEILILKYNCTRVEMIEDFMEDWSNFKDDRFEDGAELLLGMREFNQRRRELKMTEDEWVAVWMLGIIMKRKKLDKFVYQSLCDVVKAGGENVIRNFEKKFKELRVEGNRKEANSSSVMFTEKYEYYDAEKMDEDYLDDEDQEVSEVEDEDQQTYFMGTQCQARKRFNFNWSRPMYKNRPNFKWRQSPYYNPNCD